MSTSTSEVFIWYQQYLILDFLVIRSIIGINEVQNNWQKAEVNGMLGKVFAIFISRTMDTQINSFVASVVTRFVRNSW